MPIDTVFSLFGKAKDLLILIMDRLDQLKLSENVVSRIKENLEYLQLTVKKIEPYLKRDSDVEEIVQFLTHLQKASLSCSDISERHNIVKFAKAPGYLMKLHALEAEIKMANSKLLLFIAANNLTMVCEATDFEKEKLSKIAVLQENSRAGLNLIEDKSVRRPQAPSGLNIQENNNKFLLSWKPCGGTVDEYEVCYNEYEDSSIIVAGKFTSIELESPRVQPGNIYVMKVRGINKGGKGEWSNTVIGQFTKPLPQKPEISDLFLRSTIAVVTVKIPEAICVTESPVKCVEISYISATSKKLSSCVFEIEPGNDFYDFTIKELHPDCRYNFRAKTKNGEGWSKPSNLREGDTLSLPPKPFKPDCPIIEACTSTMVSFTVQVPANTCSIKSPIIAWKVFGYRADRKAFIHFKEVDQNDFTSKSINITVSDLNPNLQYTLQLQAKNENGWSEPSDKFEIHIATPSTPQNVRVSSKRTHSLIKIRWNAPDSTLITHYEVAGRTKKGNYTKEAVKVPANKFSVTFTKLNQNTYYCFRARTCNGPHASAWSEEIETNTRIHKGIKAVFSPAVWALGTMASPFLTPIGTGVLAGEAANKASGKKTAVAAGTAGAVGGAALGIVGAPLMGAAFAHGFVHGVDELSDQSDDEDAVIIEC